MSRAQKRSEPESVTISLPKQHYEYLTYLASIGRFGVTESEVAAVLLIRELDAKEEAGYPKVKALRAL